MVEIQIKTLKAFSSAIENKIQSSFDNTLWFRGCGNSSYKLSPSIHRHPEISDPKEIIILEQKIINRFKQRSIPFLNRDLNLDNKWEVLFYMQHFGTPTRLLDWSESPYIALYFAATCANYKRNGKKIEYQDDIAIWFLDPIKWNRKILEDVGFSEGIISYESKLIDSFEPFTDYNLMREKPIAIYGTHNSGRIVAQRGVFTIFGKGIKPMEVLFEEDNFPADALIKIIIPKDKINGILNSLISIGVTDSVVFPDLDGLSKEVKRFYKFDI